MADFGRVYVNETKGALAIGNDALERRISVRNHTAGTTDLRNKLDGTEERIESSEFELEMQNDGKLTASDFTYVRHWIEGLDEGGKRLTIRLERTDLFLDLVYELSESDFFMRKYLVIEPKTGSACTIDNVVVDELHGEAFLRHRDVQTPEAPTVLTSEGADYSPGRGLYSGGLGQPVYIGDMFFGLEYPGGENTYPPLRLRHYSGVQFAKRFESKKAVFGVAPKGKVADWFLHRYLPRIRIRPARPFIIHNNNLSFGSWGEELTDQRVVDEVAFLNEKFHEKRMPPLDSFALDVGWSDRESVWEIDRKKLPEGIQPLVRKLEEIGARLGLWVSIAGCTLDAAWGERMGLEVRRLSDLPPTFHYRCQSGCYCIAGSRYRAALKESLGRYVREAKVNYFKFDYNLFDCQNPEHGHPTGRAAQDAIIDAYIDVLDFLNGCGPDLFLAVTSGAFLSPWWLMYADSLWIGGLDVYPLSGPGSLEIWR